jgi:hypothetical protein
MSHSTLAKRTTLRAEDLADALMVSVEDIYAYCDIFDQDPDDEWALNEGEHFVWINKSLRARSFTEAGAVELAKYVEREVDSKSFLRKIKKIFVRKHARLVKSLVVARVSEAAVVDGAMVIRGGKPFVSTRQTREILRLHRRQDILKAAFEHEMRGLSGRAPMADGIHFSQYPDDDQRFYSADGIQRLSMALQVVCTSRSTRSWNEAVADSIFKALDAVARPLLIEDKLLTAAVWASKVRAGHRCELTHRSKSKFNLQFSLAAHHLFDAASHRYLKAEANNLIAIDSRLHDDFHQWNGGRSKPCTPEDFLAWIELHADDIFSNLDDPIGRQADAVANIKRRIEMLRPIVNSRN